MADNLCNFNLGKCEGFYKDRNISYDMPQIQDVLIHQQQQQQQQQTTNIKDNGFNQQTMRCFTPTPCCSSPTNNPPSGCALQCPT
jgi:hypothetical protein